MTPAGYTRPDGLRDTRDLPWEPSEPFVFHYEPPHWRWCSFVQAGRRIAALRRRLQDVKSGTRVAWAAPPSLAGLLADLAVRSSGLVSVPIAGAWGEEADGEALTEALSASGAEVWVDLGGVSADSLPPDLEIVTATGEEVGNEVGAVEEAAIGGCLVRAESANWVEVQPADLASSADRLARALGELRARPILLHTRRLSSVEERVVVEWAVRAGAALVAVTEATAVAASVAWARPTVVHGSAPMLCELAEALRSAEPDERRLRRRFGRLERVVCGGGGAVDPASARLFALLGSRIVPLPLPSLQG